MIRFSVAKVHRQIRNRGLDQETFITECIQKAPPSMKPSRSYLKQILNGGFKRGVGSDYVGLFATVLGCTTDSLFTIKQ